MVKKHFINKKYKLQKNTYRVIENFLDSRMYILPLLLSNENIDIFYTWTRAEQFVEKHFT